MVAVFALVRRRLVRAAWLQGVRAGGSGALAASQHRETVSIPARRGTIYDRTGRAFAIGEQATTVYANLKQIRDPEDVAERYCDRARPRRGGSLAASSDRSKGFVYLERKADPEQAELLEAQNIVGSASCGGTPRLPEGGDRLRGRGLRGLDNEGLAGLELELDGVLSGSPGSESVVRDPFGRALVLETKPVAHGGDVYLTLDETLQGQVERILAQTRDQWGAKSATAIVLDPKTAASWPWRSNLLRTRTATRCVA